ncbi:hypothetical protein SAMN04489716_5270 [Actinoplanes derwentensis]|uniref:Uncharacterized protein n=1 Tax=Actinoplanes derwentensis TaxID=113562 RepID=A0A1H2C5H5_9ACTN|nr:hypothetical protein SAMN04489716_5270 [Actinoplanes derwentensis]
MEAYSERFATNWFHNDQGRPEVRHSHPEDCLWPRSASAR